MTRSISLKWRKSMKKNSIVTIKRMIASCLILLMTANTTSFASSSNNLPEASIVELEYGTSVTYDVEKQKIEYGIDQNGCLSENNILGEILDNEESSIPSTREIIGSDDRIRVNNTTDSPYRNVCFVEVTFPNGTKYRGSGTLVYFDVLLTAGHVIYSQENGGWATSVEVIPGMIDYNNRPLGSTVATQITTNSEWINNRNYEWDWAILDLQSSFSTWQLFGYYSDYHKQVGKSVTTIGYPGDKGTNMYYSTDTVTEAGDRYMKVLCDIVQGDSGGAVINVENDRLVGIISYSHKNFWGKYDYNGMVRINEDLFNRIKAHQN